MYMHICMHEDMWIGMGYDCKYMYVTIYMLMSTHIIKLMDILIIYLISTFVHGFVFKTYTPLFTF